MRRVSPSASRKWLHPNSYAESGLSLHAAHNSKFSLAVNLTGITPVLSFFSQKQPDWDSIVYIAFPSLAPPFVISAEK